MPVTLKPNSALLIVDMQNGFCHPDGTFSKLGLPLHTRLGTTIPHIKHLREAARKHGFPIIYTRMGFASDYSDVGILEQEHASISRVDGFKRGTWDCEIIDSLAPDEQGGDFVLDKTRNSAFLKTGFEGELKRRGVDMLIVTGVGTNVCVECTVRDAINHDFRCVTVSDATATLDDEGQNATMVNLKWFGGVATTGEVLEAMEKVRMET